MYKSVAIGVAILGMTGCSSSGLVQTPPPPSPQIFLLGKVILDNNVWTYTPQPPSPIPQNTVEIAASDTTTKLLHCELRNVFDTPVQLGVGRLSSGSALARYTNQGLDLQAGYAYIFGRWPGITIGATTITSSGMRELPQTIFHDERQLKSALTTSRESGVAIEFVGSEEFRAFLFGSDEVPGAIEIRGTTGRTVSLDRRDYFAHNVPPTATQPGVLKHQASAKADSTAKSVMAQIKRCTAMAGMIN